MDWRRPKCLWIGVKSESCRLRVIWFVNARQTGQFHVVVKPPCVVLCCLRHRDVTSHSYRLNVCEKVQSCILCFKYLFSIWTFRVRIQLYAVIFSPVIIAAYCRQIVSPISGILSNSRPIGYPLSSVCWPIKKQQILRQKLEVSSSYR